MPHGKTLDLLSFHRASRWRTIEDRETTPRDRSLRGKARVKARKQANRKSKTATP